MDDPDDLDLLFSSLVNDSGLGNDLLDNRDTVAPRPIGDAKLNGVRLNGSNRFETSSKIQPTDQGTPLIQRHTAGPEPEDPPYITLPPPRRGNGLGLQPMGYRPRPQPHHTGELTAINGAAVSSTRSRVTKGRAKKRRAKRTRNDYVRGLNGGTRIKGARKRRIRKGTVWPLLITGCIAYLVALYFLSAWWFDRSDGTGGVDGLTGNATEDTVAGMVGTANTVAGIADPTGTSAPDDTGQGALTGAATFTVPATPDNPNGAPQYAVFSGGKVYLRGHVPTQAVADQAVLKAEEVLAGKVVNEMVIDPAAPVDSDNFPVYFDDYIQFAPDSSEVAPDFVPILDLAVTFLQLNPGAVVTVVARTDASGDADANLALSHRRAYTVIDYWLDRGIDESQVVADPRGEEDATVDADEDAAARDRRVEMIVSGFLTG